MSRGHSSSNTHSALNILFNLIEVQGLVDRCIILVHDVHGFVVLSHGGDVAQLGRNGGQLGTGQKHVGVIAQAVVEVAHADGHHRGAFAHLGMVAQALRTAADRGPPRAKYSLVN